MPNQINYTYEKMDSHWNNAEADIYTFKDILFLWQDTNRVRLKDASVSRYQNLIDSHILPELGNIPIEQLNTAVINRFLIKKLERGRLDCSGGLSAAYVRSIALIINAAIHFAVAEQLCPPLRTPITKPPLPKREVQVLSQENMEILTEELLHDMTEEKLLIYITLYTGLRIGEACALRWENIDFDCQIISIKHTISRIWYTDNGKKRSRLILSSPKTRSSLRYIPMCSSVYKILHDFPHRKTQGYILTGKDTESFVSPRTFEYRYKQILKTCGLKCVNYHVLRHTFATRCMECGVDMKSLCEILGHANVSITLNTYIHSSIELKRLQLEKLVAQLSSNQA